MPVSVKVKITPVNPFVQSLLNGDIPEFRKFIGKVISGVLATGGLRDTIKTAAKSIPEIRWEEDG